MAENERPPQDRMNDICTEFSFYPYRCAYICTGWCLGSVQMCWPHICTGGSHQLTFVLGGLDQAPTGLCERTFVSIGGSN
jgi:hypothetical protein